MISVLGAGRALGGGNGHKRWFVLCLLRGKGECQERAGGGVGGGDGVPVL